MSSFAGAALTAGVQVGLALIPGGEAAEGIAGGAQNALARPALAGLPSFESASLAFAADGNRSDGALADVRKIIPSSEIGNPAVHVKQDAWLTVGKEYVVLSVNGRGSTIKYRLFGDDRTTPALHNAEQFEITSPKIPEDWVFRIYPKASEWVITPSSWAEEGFWMAYFDGDAAACCRSQFKF